MNNRFSELQQIVTALESDFTKFYEQGNKAAGTRLRQAMLELKNKAQDIRLQVQELKNKDA